MTKTQKKLKFSFIHGAGALVPLVPKSQRNVGLKFLYSELKKGVTVQGSYASTSEEL